MQASKHTSGLVSTAALQHQQNISVDLSVAPPLYLHWVCGRQATVVLGFYLFKVSTYTHCSRILPLQCVFFPQTACKMIFCRSPLRYSTPDLPHNHCHHPCYLNGACGRIPTQTIKRINAHLRTFDRFHASTFSQLAESQTYGQVKSIEAPNTYLSNQARPCVTVNHVLV